MPFEKGDARINRGGRVPGRLNKLSKQVQRSIVEIRQSIERAGDATPVEYMLREMNNETNSPEFRVYCAINAAPYIHRRMPAGIELQTSVDPNDAHIATARELEALLTEELSELLRLTRKINAARDLTLEMAGADD